MVQILFILNIIFVVYFSVNTSVANGGVSYTDEMAHLIAYGAMGFLAYLSANSINKRVYFFLLIIGLGLTLELVQSFLPSRSASLVDIIANFFGAVSGYLLGWLALKSGLRKFFPKENLTSD